MRRLCLLGFLFLALNSAALYAEDTQSAQEEASPDETAAQDSPRFRGRTVVLEINARLVEQNLVVVWNEFHRAVTISGRPVEIKLAGANIAISAQFTPYIRRGAQKFLVAQGQIWMDIPDQGIRYHAFMQTIPLEYSEEIYFFPLGTLTDNNAASIEVMLTLLPYDED